MIVAISCSSPFSSVAVITEGGEVIFVAREETKQNASGLCLRMLQSSGVPLRDVKLYVADVGPGSFIGVRVGVTLAKTLAFANSVLAAGVTSFDLIDPDRTVAFPSKKGEWFIRRPGEEVGRAPALGEGQKLIHSPQGTDQTKPLSSVREAGELANRKRGTEHESLQAYVGYGPGFEKQTYPDAALVASLLNRLEPVEPELLLPEYHIEPSISTPKVPYKQLSS